MVLKSLKGLLMGHHLEREIRLSEESEYKNLYRWSLQEFDNEGKKLGRDQVPWIWSLFFTTSELMINKSLNISRIKDDENQVAEKVRVVGNEYIVATLHSGDSKWLENDVSFSMFGTGRKINSFKLYIYKLNDGETNEYCKLWGSVSNTYQNDFVDETSDDTTEIYVGLLPQRFNDLTQTIKSKNVDFVQVHLNGVSGFYSEWSPSIRTNQIKILAPKTFSGDGQKVACSEECNIVPPRLGEVGEFQLTITQRVKLKPKQDLSQIEINKILGDEDEEEILEDKFPSAELNTNAVLVKQFARNELAITKLHKPIWIICFLLSLLFLKYFV